MGAPPPDPRLGSRFRARHISPLPLLQTTSDAPEGEGKSPLTQIPGSAPVCQLVNWLVSQKDVYASLNKCVSKTQ